MTGYLKVIGKAVVAKTTSGPVGVVCSATAVTIVLVLSLISTAGAKQLQLESSDCRKCHYEAADLVASSGARHASFGCTACHQGHAPSAKSSITACGKCHSANRAHFQVKKCRNCHTVAHTPLSIRLQGTETNICAECHSDANAALRDTKTGHGGLACTECHGGQHRYKPDCVGCHKPHRTGQDGKSCRECHCDPHNPMPVQYTSNISGLECGACHDAAVQKMQMSGTRHKNVPCATCHKQHGLLPSCRDCHPRPHSAVISSRWPECRECHGKAHSLWLLD